MEEKGQPISRSVDAEELVAEGSCLVSLIAADAVPEDEVEVQVGSREFAEACRSLDHRSFGYKVTKRVFDILFSGVVVVVGFLPCALLSIAIAVDTKGSPIYTQTRIGKNGKTFRIKKFRTMVVDSDDVEKYFSEDQLKLWKRERKVDNDPRVDSRIIETNTRRPLSALVFASVSLPKNTVVSAMFPQVKVQIIYPAEMVEKFFAQAGRKTAQFSQKLAKRIFALLKGLNNRVRIPSGAAGFIQSASA